MLKLYIKTIIVCVVGTLLSVIISVYLESSTSQIGPLLQNYAVGLACSLVVVILTTLLQYLHEINRLTNEIMFNIKWIFLCRFLFVLSLCSNEERGVKLFYDEMDKEISEATDKISQIDFFSKRKNHIYMELSKRLLSLRAEELKYINSPKEIIIEKIILCDEFSEIKKLVFSLTKDDSLKDSILEYCFKVDNEISLLNKNQEGEVTT